ncbi:MAG: hypothetical protein PHF00_11895 [Elusimicrobia bacterium]|nr:hypothetical protein [Elusimicrobiota bacterium]
MNKRDIAAAAAILGAFGAGACYLGPGPERFWINWLVWTLMLLSAGLGALFLTGVEHLSGARWSVPLRRCAERVSDLVVPGSAALLAALLSLPVLYPWARPGGAPRLAPELRAAWLNVPFFSLRTAVCAGLWLLCWRILAGGSRRQDRSRDPALTLRARRWAAVYMAVLGFSLLFVAYDWIVSLEPEWYSDVIGVYLFAGAFLSGVAASSLVVARLLRAGRLPGVRFDHVYSLGAWLFAFTVFWSYIAFAQYLLMWYANLPEEVFWYKQRTQGPWQAAALALAALHFLIPFFALLPVDAKGDLPGLRRCALIVLAAQFLDLYWLIFPAVCPRPVFSWPEACFALLFMGAAALWLRRSLGRDADMPVGDPFLKDGLEFRL